MRKLIVAVFALVVCCGATSAEAFWRRCCPPVYCCPPVAYYCPPPVVCYKPPVRTCGPAGCYAPRVSYAVPYAYGYYPYAPVYVVRAW